MMPFSKFLLHIHLGVFQREEARRVRGHGEKGKRWVILSKSGMCF